MSYHIHVSFVLNQWPKINNCGKRFFIVIRIVCILIVVLLRLFSNVVQTIRCPNLPTVLQSPNVWVLNQACHRYLQSLSAAHKDVLTLLSPVLFAMIVCIAHAFTVSY